ncbi:cytochrome-c peroxidase [Arcobacter sp. FW59]|nr:cytochrome-c peroxidase [Arcobacter sp. FW59]
MILKNLLVSIYLLSCSIYAQDIFYKDGNWNFSELRKVYSSDSSKWPKPNIDKNIKHKELKAVSSVDEKVLNEPIVKLGKRLFHEPRLSKNNDISCATCHVPNNAFIQNTTISVGHNGLEGTRNAPTLFGLQNTKHLFWDGRAQSLEEQAIGPILNPVEMALTIEELKDKIKLLTGYEQELKDIYGDTNFTVERIAESIASFEKTLKAPKTKFDNFLDGDINSLNDMEVLGLHLFRTKARCINCHNGENFNDGEFHNLGLTYYGREKYEDWGLYHTTKKDEDVGKFKTPTLRQISKTAPYMHNGLFPSLRGIINMYNVGMFNPQPNKAQLNDPKFPKTSPILQKLDLTDKEISALLMFLNTL